MSEVPPQVPYASYQTAAPSPRPTAVTVLAIIGIVLGSLASLGSLCSAISMLTMGQILGRGAPNPMLTDPAMRGFSFFSHFVNMGMGVLLLTASIKCLSLRAWAWKAMLWWAAADVVWLLFSAGITVFWTMPHMTAAMATSGPAGGAAFAGQFQTFFVCSAVGGFVLWMVYPVRVLVHFQKPRIKAAFGITGGR